MSEPMKRVLVTGGNKGIGRAICHKLLEEHADVQVLLGSRDKRRGEKTVKELVSEVSGCENRLELVQIDTSSDDSVQKAAEEVTRKGKLYGIVNNAGILGQGISYGTTLGTNYFGPRRVCDKFGKYLIRPGGRIVNISSASGPMYVKGCSQTLKQKLADPLSIAGDIDELDEIAKSFVGQMGGDGYGLSKALLSAYTVLHAQSEPDLIINACSPGYIATDMTGGMGAGKNPPSKGAVCPVWLLTSPDLEKVPSGRYYGSDCVRSPLHEYRGPGDPPYEGP